ncbi:MAG TPA: ABC transporter permease [Thermoplasmatales archaeon]|nr:ABC transporter permease [Thermoplasmatales archaeon]
MNMFDEFIMRAIIAIFLLAINASIAGSFVIFKNVPFLVAGASHAALAGSAVFIAIESYMKIDPIVGAIIFAILVAFSASKAKQANVAIGISFAFSMSLAVLFISFIKEQASRVWGLLFGDLLLITNEDIILMAIMTAVVIIISLLFAREFIFISFDMEGAKASGIKAEYFNYVLLSIISISTVITMKAVGAILVYAMLVAPSASANKIAKSVSGVFIFSAFFALIAGFFGLALSFYLPFSPSAITALIATLIYFILFRKFQ